MKKEFLVFCMDWLASNTPQLVQLLTALVPVLALCIAGYAMYAINSKNKESCAGGKHD